MFLLLQAIRIDELESKVDGLSFVNYDAKEESTAVEFSAKKHNISIVYQKTKDIELCFLTEHDCNKDNIKNGMILPMNTAIQVKANWSIHDDYVLSFVDISSCDSFKFTNNNNELMFIESKKNKTTCIYNLHKNSHIRIEEETYSKFAKIKGRSVAVYYERKYFLDDAMQFVQDDKLAQQRLEMFKILENLSIVTTVVGVFAYLIIGLLFNTEFCVNNCVCIGKCARVFTDEKFQGKDNPFFTETLVEFGDFEVKE